ncbi:MAG: SDR family NAD(P)-dependent oxidoreductase [Alphaproteobacteria bacterium]
MFALGFSRPYPRGDAMSFGGKHVVVTGGTGALGSAVVARLLDEGAACHVPVFEEAELERAPFAGHANFHATSDMDLTDERRVEAFFGELPALWASLHIAGGFAMTPIAKLTKAGILAQLDMNAVTAFLCCREAVRSIRRTGEGGRIVNVAARPALEPRTGAGMTAYTASKAAVAALTQALAEEVAAEGIWVNAVVPSILDTPANREAMPKADHDRWPGVDEVAETILFLASPANRTTRGALVAVYGRS